MRPHRSFCFVFAMALANSAAACLWTYATNLDGQVNEVESLPPQEFAAALKSKKPREIWRVQAAMLKQRSAEKPMDHKLRNNYAVALVRAGELDEALAELDEIEAKKPGLYPTAANLGTVYELNGDVEKALYWIKEGITRNRQSHYGSEWLHVQILQAKRELATNADWLETHFVLGLEFGTEARPAKPSPESVERLQGPKDLDELSDHLQYQLRERISLVDPPDEIVADLLFDLSNVLALSGKLENAIAATELSQQFAAHPRALVQARLDHFRSIVARANKPLLLPNELLNLRLKQLVTVPSLGFVMLPVGILWLLRVKKRKRRATPLNGFHNGKRDQPLCKRRNQRVWPRCQTTSRE